MRIFRSTDLRPFYSSQSFDQFPSLTRPDEEEGETTRPLECVRVLYVKIDR